MPEPDLDVATVDPDLEKRAIDVVRGLAMDMPQRAQSGHPGTAMALAPLAYVLWTRVMTYDASAPHWFDRDRFVLSAGHASPLIYSMLHLTGFGLELDDLRQFRQWGSLTPGHPEVHHTTGVEVTTGPLGQGFGDGVGMGMAERWLRSRFGADLCDHHTFVICSDGDLEEGITQEAASLAGHLQLGRLVYVYDDNHISIDGPTELAFTDDTPKRFEALGWHVEELGEAANDPGALEAGVRRAMAVDDAPSLVVLRSHIGWPSPTYTDTAHAHGSPLGEDEVRATKEILGLPPDETFYVPDDVLEHYRAAGVRGRPAREAWEQAQADRPDDGSREVIEACLAGRGLTGWDAKLPSWEPGEKLATRKSSAACLNAIVDVVPGLLPGAADLTGNTGVALDDEPPLSAETPAARQVHYGIREHGMGAAMVGMAMHGGVLPVGGTFFCFSDYMRGSVRLAALSQAKVVFSWTHDSIGLGEDGPTHQPIEHLASLRAMPGLRLIRPADANESAQAWRLAVELDGPTALILTRQGVPVLEGTDGDGVARGAYVLVDAPATAGPDVVLIGTGSEVQLCVGAAEQLRDGGIAAQVVSMPSWELFEEQSVEYQEVVLPTGVPSLAVEAASSFGWERWADDSVTHDGFGASAPGATAMAELGFTVEHVVERARRLVDDLAAS